MERRRVVTRSTFDVAGFSDQECTGVELDDGVEFMVDFGDAGEVGAYS